MTCPSTLYAGTLWEFTVTDSERLPSDGWSLAFRFSGATNFGLTVTALPDNTGWLVRHDSAASASVAPGRYEWFALATKSGETTPIAQGYTQVAANPATATNMDSRSFAAKALEAVEAVLANGGTLANRKYEIAGRSLERHSLPELLALRDKLKSEVKAEENCARIAQGLPSRNRIFVRFGQ